MTDAVLLARARGSRNKPHSRRHALRLTLLVHFADENYPEIGRGGRNPSEARTIFIRSVAEVLTAEIRRRVTAKAGAGKPVLDNARVTP